MTLHFEPADAAALRSEWSSLAAAAGNVFGTPEFVETWWRHFGGEREPLLYAARVEGRVRAIVSLFAERRGPVRLLRLAGAGPGDELGPVCAPEDRPSALAGLRSLAEQIPHDVFLAEQLRADAVSAAALGARIVSTEGSPVLGRPEAGWEEFLKAGSKNFREQVRRRERKLFREHEATFRPGDPGRLDEDLDLLYSLHGARWRQGSSFAADEAFQRSFAKIASEQGWLRLWFLEVDGAPRAAWQGFRYGGAEAYYQAGRDPVWDHASVGFVLLAHTIRAAFEDDVSEYRFLRGAEPYKYRFADSDPGLVTVGRGSGTVGRVALAAAVAVRAARRRISRWVSRASTDV